MKGPEDIPDEPAGVRSIEPGPKLVAETLKWYGAWKTQAAETLRLAKAADEANTNAARSRLVALGAIAGAALVVAVTSWFSGGLVCP